MLTHSALVIFGLLPLCLAFTNTGKVKVYVVIIIIIISIYLIIIIIITIIIIIIIIIIKIGLKRHHYPTIPHGPCSSKSRFFLVGQYKTWTADCGLSTKYELGLKRRLEKYGLGIKHRL